MDGVAQIHERALLAARRYKVAEIELIEVLQQVGEHRVFYHLNYNSLFQSAVQALGLSEEVAYIYINVSRKASEVPALKEEIKAGNISVSKAKIISPVLNQANQAHWLELAKTHTKRQIQRRVALASPPHAVRELTTFTQNPIAEHTKILRLPEIYVELTLGIPEPLMLKLRHVQDLVSQSTQTHATLVQTLEAMMNLFIDKKDPLSRAQRQKMRGKLDANVKKLDPDPVNVHGALSAATKHQVYLRYQWQCAFTDGEGRRCSQRRHLDIHHKIEVANGGTNELENLILLCRGHHRAKHISPKSGDDFRL